MAATLLRSCFLVLCFVLGLSADDVTPKDLLGKWRVDPEELWKQTSSDAEHKGMKAAQLKEEKEKTYTAARDTRLQITEDKLILNGGPVHYVVKSVDGHVIHLGMKDPDDETKVTNLDATIDGDRMRLGGPEGSVIYRRVLAVTPGDLIGKWCIDIDASWNKNPATRALVAGGVSEQDLKKMKDSMYEKAVGSTLEFSNGVLVFKVGSSKMTGSYQVTQIDDSTMHIVVTPTDGANGWRPFDVSILGDQLAFIASDGVTIYQRTDH